MLWWPVWESDVERNVGADDVVMRYLTWILAGLFLVFGLIGLVSGSLAWQRFWVGLATLCLGGFGLPMARDALITGHIRLQHSVIRYGQQPRVFWAIVILVAAAGAGTLISGFWFLFLKG